MNKFVKFQLSIAVFLLVTGAFFGGYYFGVRGYAVELKKNPPEVRITNKDSISTDVDFGLFWDVWERVHKDYLERPVDSKKMLYGAIEGMVQALDDPYTSFLPPQVNEVINNSLEGVYEGIGAELSIKDNQLIIVAPLDGSPSQEAGVLAGDKIIEIDGVSTTGININEAVSKIRGNAGTKVTLTIYRDDTGARKIEITRDKIKVDSVTWKDLGDGTAYIRVSRFGGETSKEWSTVASEVNVKMSELDALIIDLRGNPGGYMGAAVHIVGEFYGGKPVLYQEDATGKQVALKSDRTGAFSRVPAVFVLIDGGSASASEILAAALRDEFGAKLVGVKSFGKGTIQTTDNFDDGSGIHITIAKWLTPKKEWVHKVGLSPDYVVEISKDDIEKKFDSQLEKAKELAKEF